MQIKRKIIKFMKKIIYRENESSESYIHFLRKQGIMIGEEVEIFNPKNVIIDFQYPWLVEIGDNVKITDGVKILTHDFSWSVIKNYEKRPGEILGASGKVSIGNNVFFGMNSIVTRNVTIGDNVIIGAGSVVTSDCEGGFVYAGVPAKKIMKIEEYIIKREQAQLEEAKELFLIYRDKYNEEPPMEKFFEYFMLFMTVNQAEKIPQFMKQLNIGKGRALEYTKEFYIKKKPLFSSYEKFKQYCLKESNSIL